MYENHKTLGKGFREVVYKDAMEIEFKNTDIPHERKTILHSVWGNYSRPSL